MIKKIFQNLKIVNILIILVILTTNTFAFGSIDSNNNSEIEQILNILESTKTQLESSSKSGRIISKKISLLIQTLKNSSRDKRCTERINKVKLSLQKLVITILNKTCNDPTSSLSPKQSKCIPASNSESSISLLGNAIDSIENILSSDTNNDLIPDVCTSSDQTNPDSPDGNGIEGSTSIPWPVQSIPISKPTINTQPIPLAGIELIQQAHTNLKNAEDELKLAPGSIGKGTASDLNREVTVGLARDIKFSSGDNICTQRIQTKLDTLDQRFITGIENSNCEKNSSLTTDECIPANTVNQTLTLLENAKKNIQDALNIDENGDQIADVCTYFAESETTDQPIPESFLQSNEPYPIPGHYILEFNGTSSSSNNILQQFDDDSLLKVKHLYNHVFNGASIYGPPLDSQEKADFLKRFTFIEDIVQDYRFKALVPIAETTTGLTRKDTTSLYQVKQKPTIIPQGILWIEANKNENEGLGDASPSTGHTAVAVLDTGIDLDHPDLKDNIDKILSRDLTVNFRAPGNGGDDDAGHGTAVAGIISAQPGNTTDFGDFLGDVIGVGSLIKLVSLKVARSDLSFDHKDIIAGLDFVLGHADEIAVANLSLSGCINAVPPEDDPIMENINKVKNSIKALADAGIIVVTSAGNSLKNIHEDFCIPSIYPEVITVSGLYDSDGIRNNEDKWFSLDSSQGSNYGKEVDIIAPGQDVITTKIGSIAPTQLSGTSFSTPHVSGTIVLYIAKNGKPKSGDASKEEVQKIIKAISIQRTKPLPGEPSGSIKDGFFEPFLNANRPLLRP